MDPHSGPSVEGVGGGGRRREVRYLNIFFSRQP